MKLVNPKSLAATIDTLNEAFFFGRKLSRSQRIEAAAWIASRQGEQGSYWGLPAPTKTDFDGIRLFTGEKINAGRHWPRKCWRGSDGVTGGPT